MKPEKFKLEIKSVLLSNMNVTARPSTVSLALPILLGYSSNSPGRQLAMESRGGHLTLSRGMTSSVSCSVQDVQYFCSM